MMCTDKKEYYSAKKEQIITFTTVTEKNLKNNAKGKKVRLLILGLFILNIKTR